MTSMDFIKISSDIIDNALNEYKDHAMRLTRLFNKAGGYSSNSYQEGLLDKITNHHMYSKMVLQDAAVVLGKELNTDSAVIMSILNKHYVLED
jgi:hypothetical protein